MSVGLGLEGGGEVEDGVVEGWGTALGRRVALV